MVSFVFRIGRLDHGVVGCRVVPPAGPGFEVHGTELPVLARIGGARGEAFLLNLLTVEEVLDQDDAFFDSKYCRGSPFCVRRIPAW